MAFWMDPLLVAALGIAVAWLSKRWFPRNQYFVYVASALVIGATYVVSIGLFVNFPVLEPVWEFLGAESGTEYMINGIVLDIAEPGVSWTELSREAAFSSIFIFTLYPSWLWFGIVVGRISFGRHSKQGGLIGLLRP